MTHKDILVMESENSDRIFLHSEGIFWKAYERSAFNFVSNVKPFRPTRKYVASAGGDVVSIGFPAAGLDALISQDRIVERNPKLLVVRADKIADEKFNEWKQSLPVTEPAVKNKADQPSKAIQTTAEKECLCRELSRRLMDFNIEGKTPMECMLLVVEMKTMITNQNNRG